MAVIPSIIRRLYANRLNQINQFRINPDGIQQKVLSEILAAAASTEWGKQYGFPSIRTAADFKTRVPVRSYDDYKPLIDRLRAGESDLTWPGSFRWFAKSSGTT